jgi:hypothetical protein
LTAFVWTAGQAWLIESAMLPAVKLHANLAASKFMHQQTEDESMKRLLSFVLLVSIGAFGFAGQASAGDECGAGLDDNWNVKQAGDIKSHLKHHLKIDKTGSGKYSVRIKNEEGDNLFKSAKDFSLSGSGKK